MNGRSLFAAVRGLAGAALGAFLTLRLWNALFLFLRARGIETSLVFLGLFLPCPAAYLGYWCLRGLRRRRFAYAAAWGSAFAALLLAAEPDTPPGWLGAGLLSGFAVFLSRRFFQESFLRYADPAWYKDPRRVAAGNGGGRSPNRCGPETGFGLLVPDSFAVNEGGGGAVLYVRGTVLRWEPRLAKGRTFSAGDVAGVIVGPACNALYDSEGETLARFRTSQKNGPLLARYLRDRGVPFYSLSEVPKTGPLPSGKSPEPAAPTSLGEAVWEAVSEYAAELEEKEAPPIRHTDLSRHFSRDYTLVLRRTIPFGALTGGGLGLGLIAFFAGFPIIAIHNGPYVFLELKLLLAAVIVLIAGPWVFAAVKGEVFPPRLSVENGHIWLDKDFFPLREIPLERLGRLGWQQSDECYILYDKNGRPLAKFSTRDEFGPQFLNFLTDHDIKISR